MMAMPVQSLPRTEQSGGVRIITFTAGKLREVESVIASELEGCTDASAGCHVLLDFTNVERMSGLELRTLVSLHKKMTASGGRLTMFNMKAEIYEVFAVALLHTFLGISREKDAQTSARSAMNAFADLAPDLEAYFHAASWSRRYPRQAGSRLEEEFRLVLGPEALDAIVACMEQDEATTSTNMSRKRLRGVALELMMWEVLQGLQEEDAAVTGVMLPGHL